MSTHSSSSQDRQPGAWVRPLLRWYDLHRRDLPWRKRASPYRVWISEVMLQQTRVETAIPYYRRFLARFPDVATLAAADLQAVLKLWEGLGYYARARNLHRAAKEVLRRYAGRMPASSDELRTLPGIGEYSAAAIASISAGEPAPVVDGNVARVMARFLRLTEPIQRVSVRRRIGAYLGQWIPPARPGDFNQALMELGALVCKPAAPACGDCPVRPLCVAHLEDLTGCLPVRTSRKRIPHRTVAVALILRRKRILAVRRRQQGVLGGLWEFPGGQPVRGESLEQALRRTVEEDTGVRVRPERKLCTVRQEYSHFGITLHAFLCGLEPGRTAARGNTRWLPLVSLDDHAFGRAARRVSDRLKAEVD